MYNKVVDEHGLLTTSIVLLKKEGHLVLCLHDNIYFQSATLQNWCKYRSLHKYFCLTVFKVLSVLWLTSFEPRCLI